MCFYYDVANFSIAVEGFFLASKLNVPNLVLRVLFYDSRTLNSLIRIRHTFLKVFDVKVRECNRILG
jgi:hypothetical protein